MTKQKSKERKKLTKPSSTGVPSLPAGIKKPSSYVSSMQKSTGSSTLTKTQQKMKQKLSAGKFRHLNELLYTKSSKDSVKLFTKEPNLFKDYHDGFKEQVVQWPKKPLDFIFEKIIKIYGSCDKKQKFVVADMGCGEALLAQALKDHDDFKSNSENIEMHSFDIIPLNDRVTAANIANVPLKNDSANVVVFCLSLMGSDYKDFIKEAERILKPGGWLLIAEVNSRFENKEGIAKFYDGVETMGFQKVNRDDLSEMFVLMYFRKISKGSEDKKNKSQAKKIKRPALGELKACKYKKR
jgi:ribosomal RNA-processing protein 8